MCGNGSTPAGSVTSIFSAESQESLVKENTCVYIKCRYIIDTASHKISSPYPLKWWNLGLSQNVRKETKVVRLRLILVLNLYYPRYKTGLFKAGMGHFDFF